MTPDDSKINRPITINAAISAYGRARCGLELLATVHWIASKEGARSIEDIVRMTYAWNDRKRQFTSRQIALTADVLSRKGRMQTVNETNSA